MEAIKKKLQDEIEKLEHELHFELPKHIQHAREFGDLKENAEYKAAKERQSMVQARISQLHQRMMEVDSIELVPFGSITKAEAQQAGSPDIEALRAITAHAGPVHDDTLVHRVEFHLVDPAPERDSAGERRE